jgi:adenosylhomocysteinase
MGSNVIVTEVDPVRALEAYMDGFRVMSMSEAAKIGDIFVTASGDKDLIRKEHMERMKSGAILANSGHFNVEINIKDLESLSSSKSTVKPNVEEYKLKNGKKLYLLGEGRLVNLAAAEGHPSEVMQMSFANQALCAKYLKENKGRLENKVYNVPKEIDSRIANLALKAAGIEIDVLSPEQKKYLESWQEGT